MEEGLKVTLEDQTIGKYNILSFGAAYFVVGAGCSEAYPFPDFNPQSGIAGNDVIVAMIEGGLIENSTIKGNYAFEFSAVLQP